MSGPEGDTGEQSPPARPGSSSRWRVALAVAALLVGLGGGYLLHQLVHGSTSPGPVDIGFTQDMIQHHQQAVVMNQLVHGSVGPQVSALAESIAADQLREIGRMEGYLDVWDEPSVPGSSSMEWMEHGHGEHHTAAGHGTPMVMPGMATQDELNRLGAATGPDADRLYLTLMIRHHQGAVDMAGYAAQHASTSQLRDFAAATSFHQQEEIKGMTKLQAQLRG